MTIDEDRQTFREGVMEARALIEAGDAAQANAINEALTPIADRWDSSGRLGELLTPLLVESEPAWVRYNAASGLLAHGYSDEAVPVLEELQSSDTTFAGLGAERVLTTWRKADTDGSERS